jgi:hypothetical protein
MDVLDYSKRSTDPSGINIYNQICDILGGDYLNMKYYESESLNKIQDNKWFDNTYDVIRKN